MKVLLFLWNRCICSTYLNICTKKYILKIYFTYTRSLIICTALWFCIKTCVESKYVFVLSDSSCWQIIKCLKIGLKESALCLVNQMMTWFFGIRRLQFKGRIKIKLKYILIFYKHIWLFIKTRFSLYSPHLIIYFVLWDFYRNNINLYL